MPDTPIASFTNGATAQATDRIAAARAPYTSGNDVYLTPLQIATYIYTQSNTEVIALAALQAKAIAGTIVPMRMYVTTISAGYVLYLLGASTTTVYKAFDYGQIRTAAMSGSIFGSGQYDLVTATLFEFIDPVKGNHAIGALSCSTFPFDDGTCNRNTIDNIAGFVNLNSALCEDNYFGPGSTMDIDNNSTVVFSSIQSGASVTVGSVTACELSYSIIEPGATLIMADDHHFVLCKLGMFKTIDLTTVAAAYAQTGKSYTADGSTFVCSDVIDCSGDDINLTNIAGQDVSFCGIFSNITCLANPFTTATLTTNLTDHDYLFIFVDNGFSLTFNPGTSYLLSGAQPLALSQTDDCIGITYASVSAAWKQNGNTCIPHT